MTKKFTETAKKTMSDKKPTAAVPEKRTPEAPSVTRQISTMVADIKDSRQMMAELNYGKAEKMNYIILKKR
jgi:hypothetical protein